MGWMYWQLMRPQSTHTHTFPAAPTQVVMPSSPAEAKGLLLASIQEPDPVVFFEPKMM
jgi:2-oxoisovalerate dehydrogenase E1 component beta subunit